nr:hypothetical protein SWSSV_gp059 [White spot syndrome virus]
MDNLKGEFVALKTDLTHYKTQLDRSILVFVDVVGRLYVIVNSEQTAKKEGLATRVAKQATEIQQFKDEINNKYNALTNTLDDIIYIFDHGGSFKRAKHKAIIEAREYSKPLRELECMFTRIADMLTLTFMTVYTNIITEFRHSSEQATNSINVTLGRLFLCDDLCNQLPKEEEEEEDLKQKFITFHANLYMLDTRLKKDLIIFKDVIQQLHVILQKDTYAVKEGVAIRCAKQMNEISQYRDNLKDNYNTFSNILNEIVYIFDHGGHFEEVKHKAITLTRNYLKTLMGLKCMFKRISEMLSLTFLTVYTNVIAEFINASNISDREINNYLVQLVTCNELCNQLLKPKQYRPLSLIDNIAYFSLSVQKHLSGFL